MTRQGPILVTIMGEQRLQPRQRLQRHLKMGQNTPLEPAILFGGLLIGMGFQ